MQKIPNRNPNKIALISLVVGLIVLFFGNNIAGRISCNSRKAEALVSADTFDIKESIVCNFKNISLEKLYKQGWAVLSVNKPYLDSGLKNKNGLELYTLPGDYWTKNSDTMRRFVDNAFVIDLPPGSFNSEVLISGCIGDCDYQQAGIVLLADTVNLANNLRYTMLINPPKNLVRLQTVYSVEAMGKNELGQSYNNIIMDSTARPVFSMVDLGNPTSDSIILNMTKYKGYYIFRFKVGGSDRPAIFLNIKKIEFQPKFIGLIAFQGHKTKCKVVPAVFSNLYVAPITKSEKDEFDYLIKKIEKD